MEYIYQLGIIIGVSLMGELVKAVLPFPIPASVYGMLIMLLLLCTGVIKLPQVEKTASHAIGTSKAVEMGEIQVAMSSLAIVTHGVLAVITIPIVVKIFGL